LFVDKLPKRLHSEALYEIFEQFNGCVDIRHIPEKGVCFVEFANDDMASFALWEVLEANKLIFPSDETGAMTPARIVFGKK
jgi:hypothetical protein